MKHYNLTLATPPLGEYLAVEGRRLLVHRAGPGGPADVVLPEGAAIGSEEGVREHTQAKHAMFDALAKTPGVPQARQPRLPEPAGMLVTTGSRGDATNDREGSGK